MKLFCHRCGCLQQVDNAELASLLRPFPTVLCEACVTRMSVARPENMQADPVLRRMSAVLLGHFCCSA